MNCLFLSYSCKSSTLMSGWSRSVEIIYMEAFCKLGGIVSKHVLLLLLLLSLLLFSCIHCFALSPKHTSNLLLLCQRWLCLSQWRSYFLLEFKKIWFTGGTFVLLVSWLRVWDCQGKEVMGRLIKRKDSVYLCRLCIIRLSVPCEVYFTKTLIDFITLFLKWETVLGSGQECWLELHCHASCPGSFISSWVKTGKAFKSLCAEFSKL